LAGRSIIILCIEPSGQAASLLEHALPGGHYSIVRARSGSEGVQMASAGNPDLILLSAQLPDSPEYSALKALRKNPVSQNTPVMLVAGAAQREDVLAAMRLGIVDFLSLPAADSQARAKVERALAAGEKLRQLRRDAGMLGEAVSVDISLGRTLITLREGWRDAVLKNAKTLFPPALLNRIKHDQVIFDLRNLSILQPAEAPIVARLASLFAGRVSILAGRHFGALVANSDLEENARLFLSPEELDAFFESAASHS